MANILKSTFEAGKSLASKSQGIRGFFANSAKWLATSLAVVLSSIFLVPLLKKLPFVNKWAFGGTVVASAVLIVLACALMLTPFKIVRFLAAGLGISGFLQLITPLTSQIASRVLAVVQ